MESKTAKERAREVIETAYDSILESDEIISITERGLEEAIAQAILSAESRGRVEGLTEAAEIANKQMADVGTDAPGAYMASNIKIRIRQLATELGEER